MNLVPIRGLFEAHLTVGDLDCAVGFYRDVLGLPLRMRLHTAFTVDLADVIASVARNGRIGGGIDERRSPR